MWEERGIKLAKTVLPQLSNWPCPIEMTGKGEITEFLGNWDSESVAQCSLSRIAGPQGVYVSSSIFVIYLYDIL